MSDLAIPQASLFLGIIPALILMYISLKGFEGHYKDKNIFLTFILGIVAGFISALIEIFSISIGLLYIILFPILEQLFKTIILNVGRLQKKKETVIYGLSLGLGFGAIFTPVSIIISNLQIGDDPILFALAIVGSFGMIMFHGATGVLIGYGVYIGKLAKYLIFSILLYLPITFFTFLTLYYGVGYLQISFVVYGLIIYWYATKKIMPQILEKSKKRKRIKRN